jgi:hypothetical protein
MKNKVAIRVAAFGLLLFGMIACEVYLQLRPSGAPESSNAPDATAEPAAATPAPSPRIAPPLHTSASALPPTAAAPVLRTLAAPPISSSATSDAKQRRDQGLVEFKVLHGLVIAYGDIVLGQVPDGYTGARGFTEVRPVQLWDTPVIPYVISSTLPNPQRVQTAIDYFNKNTTVSFVPYNGEKDAIVFEQGSDPMCLSLVGRQGGLQPIRLSDDHCPPPAIMHEMLHALGFVHEQMRPDRDNYVEILWDNIDPKAWPQYDMAPDALIARPLQDTPFDYQSIMLYRTDEFAAHPGSPTMRSKTDSPIAPSATGLSPQDLQSLLKIYHPEDVPHL